MPPSMHTVDIECPREKTFMTPCIARDGSLALDYDNGECVGCGIRANVALKELAEKFPPARRYLQTKDPERIADRLKEMVFKYVEYK